MECKAANCQHVVLVGQDYTIFTPLRRTLKCAWFRNHTTEEEKKGTICGDSVKIGGIVLNEETADQFGKKQSYLATKLRFKEIDVMPLCSSSTFVIEKADETHAMYKKRMCMRGVVVDAGGKRRKECTVADKKEALLEKYKQILQDQKDIGMQMNRPVDDP